MKDPLSDKNLQALNVYSNQFLDGKLPDFVKSSAVSVPSGSPMSVYGDPSNASFPCNSKEATYLSNLYFMAGEANNQPWTSNFSKDIVKDRLMKAAHFWNIKPLVESLSKTILEKSASAPLKDEDFALVINYNGLKETKFPIVNIPCVKESAAALYQDRTKYPYVWRKTAARKILNKAAELSIDLPVEHFEYLFKAAGSIVEQPQKIAHSLALRSLHFPTGVKERFLKLARELNAGNYSKNPANYEKLAEVMDKTDSVCKKAHLYGQGMPLPEEVCFASPTVKSSSSDSVLLTTGKSFSLKEIKKAGLEPLSVLDSGIVNSLVENDRGDLDLTKVAEILPTLPRDYAKLLEQSFHAVGIKPLAMDKSANVGGGTGGSNRKISSMRDWQDFLSKQDGEQVEPESWTLCFKPKFAQRTSA